MTTEQLLIVAHEFCAAHRVRITNYAALCAAAAASTAHVDGIPVHDSPARAAVAMAQVLTKFPALSAHNEHFASYCAKVFLAVADAL